jgi:hypothetical protein
MPPKKIDEVDTILKKLKKDLKKQELAEKKRQDKERENKYQIIKPFPLSEGNLRANLEEEQKIKALFEKIQSLTEEESKTELEKFSKEKGLWGRKNQFEIIITTLPESLYKNLAFEYLNQNKSLDKFWGSYTKRHRIEIDKEWEKKLADDIENERKQKILNQIMPEPVLPVKKPVEPKDKKGVIELDFDGNIIEKIPTVLKPKTKPPIVTEEKIQITQYKGCFADQRDIPWLKEMPWMENVKKTFITAPPNENKDLLSEYCFLKEKVQIGGTNWYPVKKNFSSLMCNSFRTRDGNVLTAKINTGKEVRMQVAYLTTSDKFIIQDDEVFNAERKYIYQKNLTRGKEIERLLNSKVNKNAEQLTKVRLSEILKKVAPEIKDYESAETKYIIDAVKKMVETSVSVKDLFKQLANIQVYLENPNRVFALRVKEVYYTPEILVTLTQEEKLPELFDDPYTTEDNILLITSTINREISNFIQRMGESIYQKEYVTENVPLKPSRIVPVRYNLKKWKHGCTNKDDVKDIPDAHVVYYKEDGQVYCLLISDIFNQIKTGNPSNPITGKNLDKDFIKRFVELYSKFNITETDNSDIPIPSVIVSPSPSPSPDKISPKKPLLAPKLLDKIIKNINELWNELYPEESESDDDQEEVIVEKVKSPSTKDEIDALFDSSADDDDDSKKEEHDLFGSSEKHDDDDDDDDSKKEEHDLFGSSTDSEKDDENSPGTRDIIKKGFICQKCEKDIDVNKALKTMIETNEKFHPIYFCCFPCFENYNNWPKTRIRKNKKNGDMNYTRTRIRKNKKNGGRNDTRERKIK